MNIVPKQGTLSVSYNTSGKKKSTSEITRLDSNNILHMNKTKGINVGRLLQSNFCALIPSPLNRNESRPQIGEPLASFMLVHLKVYYFKWFMAFMLFSYITQVLPFFLSIFVMKWQSLKIIILQQHEYSKCLANVDDIVMPLKQFTAI